MDEPHYLTSAQDALFQYDVATEGEFAGVSFFFFFQFALLHLRQEGRKIAATSDSRDFFFAQTENQRQTHGSMNG